MDRDELKNFLLEQCLGIEPMIARKGQIEQLLVNGMANEELIEEYEYIMNELMARIEFFNNLINQ